MEQKKLNETHKDFMDIVREDKIKLSWFESEVPAGMDVNQVYGIVFDEFGRILLRVENKDGKQVFSLAGGKPETKDKNMEETLRRETLEEVNTSLQNEVFYVGYQKVENDRKKKPYAQVRMTAKIDSVGEKLPDVDGGELYDRVLVSPEKAKELLDWGDIGNRMIEKSVEIAKEKLSIKFVENIEEKWI